MGAVDDELGGMSLRYRRSAVAERVAGRGDRAVAADRKVGSRPPVSSITTQNGYYAARGAS